MKYEIISYTGGILLATNMWPQMYQTYTTKKANDISTNTLIMTLTGLIMIIIYSIHLKDVSLYCPLLLNLSNTISLLFMKYIYMNNTIENIV